MFLKSVLQWIFPTSILKSQPLELPNLPNDRGIPSLCRIEILIKGKRIDLEKFRKCVGGCGYSIDGVSDYNHFNFDSIISIPNNELLKVSYRKSQIYLDRLRLYFWGVSSEAIGSKLIESRYTLKYSFICFDLFPEKIIRQVICNYPHLKFEVKYENMRTGIIGFSVGKYGVMKSWYKVI